MADFQKAVVEKKAKELEPNLKLDTKSSSLKRYLARVKAIEQLHPTDVEATVGEMIKKLYKPSTPPSRSWLEELNAAGETVASGFLIKFMGEPKPAPEKPATATGANGEPATARRGRGRKKDTTETVAPGQAQVAPPAPPPEAVAGVAEVLGDNPSATSALPAAPQS